MCGFWEKSGETGERARKRGELEDEPEAGEEKNVRAGEASRSVAAMSSSVSPRAPMSAAGNKPFFVGDGLVDLVLREGGRGRALDLRDVARSSVSVGSAWRSGVVGATGRPLALPNPCLRTGETSSLLYDDVGVGVEGGGIGTLDSRTGTAVRCFLFGGL